VTAAELDAALVVAASRVGPFNHIEFFPEVESTNDLALMRATAGARQGTVILADAQRSGRGRRGRVWHSPPEAGMYLSAVLRPDGWDAALSLVTLGVGVAVARAIRSAVGLEVELKWPNDIVIGRPWRKVAGILCESVTAAPRVEAVVAGIGVNLRADAVPHELAHRATALEVELGRAVDRTAFVVETLAALADVTRMLGRGETAAVLSEWRTFGSAGLGGASVRWNDDEGAQRGLARDIAGDGALVVDSSGGRRVHLVAGEVFWERLSSE
jgi:BirA family biotin operon repressor/biotin-[acetyl-CoA-carboxylase] ligase